ncbi:hypothetical protein MCERE8_01382 [Candidatus Nanopelagicaceae bacterium]
MPSDIEFIKLGRSDSDTYWKLGILPDPSQLVDIDAIVHLAWGTTDRKMNFHTNVGGTIQLASLARDLGCPFLFISSIGVNSESLYGESKFLAENGVIEVGGQVVRLGLMRTTNRYLGSKKKFFTVYPRFKNLIPITEFDSFTKFLLEWINSRPGLGMNDKATVTLVDDYCALSNLIDSKFKVSISEKIVGLSLRFLSKLDYRISDIYDGFKTIATRKDFN